MKKILEHWRKHLKEEVESIQDQYEARFYLSIIQAKEIDRTELMNFMRAIPNVTTVYREEEISTSERLFVGEYRFRFVLDAGSNSRRYYDLTLKPELRKIIGLSVQRDFGYEKIGD